MRENHSDVLVVGAGPVGLLTGLLLQNAGLIVTLIDQEDRTAARSYACALHAHTLEMLDRLGQLDAVLGKGREIHKIAYYDRGERRAELNLESAGGKYPFLLILPQDKFEAALEKAFSSRHGARVHWKHRLDAFHDEGDSVEADVEELGGTSTGYIVPHWEMVVKGRKKLRASFLIGADGHNSRVRQRLGIDLERNGKPESFAAYEFQSDTPGEPEVRVVLDDLTTNVLWPLPENKFRWTFQLTQSEAEFPDKERRALRVSDARADDHIRAYVEKVAAKRAPWFSLPVKEITWCSEVVFEHRVVEAFGKHRTWLLGDAAHQTGPAGVQSMNMGFREAESLAEHMASIFHSQAGLASLDSFNQEARRQWRRMLGLSGSARPSSDANAWIQQRAPRLVPTLPGTGPALDRLAKQLKLDWD